MEKYITELIKIWKSLEPESLLWGIALGLVIGLILSYIVDVVNDITYSVKLKAKNKQRLKIAKRILEAAHDKGKNNLGV